VIPYHVLPLLEGAVTGQNVSGLSRLVGGAAMVALGIAILRRRKAATSDELER
jgi:LPXTG-motif cell wall-anchored protein